MYAHSLQCKQRQQKLRKLLMPWYNLIKEVPPSHWRGRVRLQLSSLSLCFPFLISCHPDLTIFLEAWNQLSLIIYLFCFVLLWIPLSFFFFSSSHRRWGRKRKGSTDRNLTAIRHGWFAHPDVTWAHQELVLAWDCVHARLVITEAQETLHYLHDNLHESLRLYRPLLFASLPCSSSHAPHPVTFIYSSTACLLSLQRHNIIISAAACWWFQQLSISYCSQYFLCFVPLFFNTTSHFPKTIARWGGDVAISSARHFTSIQMCLWQKHLSSLETSVYKVS